MGGLLGGLHRKVYGNAQYSLRKGINTIKQIITAMPALNKYKNNIAQKRDYFGGLLESIKRKSPVNQRFTGLVSGERGRLSIITR